MKQRNLHGWIWADALTLLDEAERLRRQFFRLSRGPAAGRASAGEVPCWEPPVDVIETFDGLAIHVALPGVAADDVTITLAADGVGVVALRRFPATGGARIHRVEIPYGRFERHIAFPAGRFELTERSLRDGCLTLAFRRKEEDIV
jgi:HSP20 family protein